jgi:soluble lytic murein transglycosylase-like protein
MQAADEYGLDPALLVAIARQESGPSFDADARNPNSGAMGVMQFMGPTWEDENPGGDPYDPYDSIMTGARYYDKLQDYFGGDDRSALAAYNWGWGNVINNGASANALPAETQHYLDQILNTYYPQYAGR